MPDAIITLAEKRPTPPRADFAFEIDFQRGLGSASRVFEATHEFIKACERLDHELVQCIDSSIETVLILEDIQSGSIRDFQSVKERLSEGDRARFLTHEGDVEMNLSVRFPIEDIEALAVARTIESPETQMILAVKKPDYLGTSKWELRHGRKTIAAKIEDANWLGRFQRRQVEVRPGDALQCTVKIESLYGFDNELIVEKYTIINVIEVLENSYRLVELPFDDTENKKD